MTAKFLLEIVAASVMVVGLIGIFVERWHSKRGIGVRIIQFLAVVLVVPIVFVLALEKILSSETVGTLLGAVVGYILSGIGKNEAS